MEDKKKKIAEDIRLKRKELEALIASAEAMGLNVRVFSFVGSKQEISIEILEEIFY